MAGLVAEWLFNNARHRLVEIGSDFILERCERDIPGLELWVKVLGTLGLRDAGGTKCLCRGLEQLAAARDELVKARDELAKSMTYLEPLGLGT